MRISVPHTGPRGGTYHTHHTISSDPGIPLWLVLFILFLIPGYTVVSLIMGTTWDRKNRAEARETYEMMKVKASIKRTPVGKPDPSIRSAENGATLPKSRSPTPTLNLT